MRGGAGTGGGASSWRRGGAAVVVAPGNEEEEEDSDSSCPISVLRTPIPVTVATPKRAKSQRRKAEAAAIATRSEYAGMAREQHKIQEALRKATLSRGKVSSVSPCVPVALDLGDMLYALETQQRSLRTRNLTHTGRSWDVHCSSPHATPAPTDVAPGNAPGNVAASSPLPGALPGALPGGDVTVASAAAARGAGQEDEGEGGPQKQAANTPQEVSQTPPLSQGDSPHLTGNAHHSPLTIHSQRFRE
ncbi:unnamed protein product [Lampetra planeri]